MSYAMLCYAIILQRSSSSRRWLTHLFLGSAWCRDLVLGPRTGDEQESQMAPPHYSKWYRVTSTLETPQPRSMAKLRRMSRINTACDWLEVVEIHLSVDNKSSVLHHQGEGRASSGSTCWAWTHLPPALLLPVTSTSESVCDRRKHIALS